MKYAPHQKGFIMSVKKVLTPKQAVSVKKILPQSTIESDITAVEKIDTGLPANHPVRKLFAEGKLPEQIAQTKEKKSRVGEYPFIDNILIEKKFTDDEIMDKVKSEFPTCQDEKQIMKSISACRYFLNKGKRKCFIPVKDGSNKIERLYRIDGKMIPASKKPKTVKSSGKKIVDPANDPLAKIRLGPNVLKNLTTDIKKSVKKK